MQITELQKAAAQAIVNIFETGSVRGEYGDVTLMAGDTGQLTYGRSQTTLASGNLFLLIRDYCARADALLGAEMAPYLDRLAACDVVLNHDMAFRGLLKDAGGDPVMQEVQDLFFDRVYWAPAMRSADVLGVRSALGAAVVYDSTVHGSWARMRDRTREAFGELSDIGEDDWIAHYIETRRDWLATHANALLHKTVYRMDALAAIVHADNWKLALPLSVRGHAVTAEALHAQEPVKVSADPIPRRLLRLVDPPTSGPDVVWLQERLGYAGIAVETSGRFDAATDAGVRAFQAAHDLKPDGIVGPATRTALEDVPLVSPQPEAAPAAVEPMPAVRSEPPAPVPAAAPPKAPAQSVPEKIGKAGRAVGDISDKMGMFKAVWEYLSKQHPAIAGFISLIMLGLSDLRDFFAWALSGPLGSIVHLPENIPALPQTADDALRFVADLYRYVQEVAASLPAEWVYRVRVAAWVLFAYALYRLVRNRADIRKLQGDLAKARQAAGWE